MVYDLAWKFISGMSGPGPGGRALAKA